MVKIMNKEIDSSQPEVSLVYGWVLPELVDHYNHETNQFDVQNLLLLINFLTAFMTLRNIRGRDMSQGAISRSASSAFSLLSDMISSGGGKEKALSIEQIKTLGRDTNAYIQFIHETYNLVVKKLQEGDLKGLNSLVFLTNEYKDSVKEGLLGLNVVLGNNWMHPLGQEKDEDINYWAFASMICGTATGRLKDGDLEKGDTDTAVSILINLGVVEISKIESTLAVCRLIDSEYLTLLQKTKELLDNKANAAS